MFKLWSFSGGVHLDTHKEESSRVSLGTARLPEMLIYPLQQRGGREAEPVVEPGQRVLKGQVIARDGHPMNPPIHTATSGIVRAIEERELPHPSGLPGLCIVIEADGEDEALEFAGTPDYGAISPDELRAHIHEAGIVGLGGAAFPTAVKVNPGEQRPIDTLVLNGAECEPYITCDDALLRHYPGQVLGGARILMQILEVDRCLLGIEDDMPEAIAALNEELAHGGYPGVEIVPVPAIYPTGGEKQLIQVLTGREVPANGIPADAGIVCQNVGTAAAIYRAIVHGEPLIERIVTVTGQGVAQPQNLLARIGTPIADLVGQCGGYTSQAQRLILGGPMMGLALPGDDLPLVKAANCILVAGPNEVIGEKQALACIRCGACAQACPVGLLPQQLYWYSRADKLERAQDYKLADCIECGCCDVSCPSHIPLVQYFRAAKSRIAAKERDRLKAEHARERFEARQARKDEEKREKAESARRKKELLEKAKEPAQVDAQPALPAQEA
ncbi:electron transport complex subunit RsxC [Methylococcus sp. EFPC2]|uniref:electron transport complex subunit RsxC n=1 Tax=Methylococcus sp. EFPC2 TaxID=2812648 RepID=UPI0019671BDC|nr:electron transport complex subunit RsxC [Methylococcus sp. EFPC2]QSA96895.1 electron transport complex subunit RsxC [Methylococcus sp. EFPC2]